MQQFKSFRTICCRSYTCTNWVERVSIGQKRDFKSQTAREGKSAFHSKWQIADSNELQLFCHSLPGTQQIIQMTIERVLCLKTQEMISF